MALVFKRIHTKIIFWALGPTLLVMGIITLLSFVTIKNTALEVVKKRDTVLAGIAARRLSENLQKYPFFLQTLAENQALRAMNTETMDEAASLTRNWLHFFDAGIVVYDSSGTALWSYPDEAEPAHGRFPDSQGFARIQETLRPGFSNILFPEKDGQGVIVIGVPVIGDSGKFLGAVAGISSIDHSILGTTYTRVLEYNAGKSSFAFLVDGNGRVLYHRHSSLIGSVMTPGEAVDQVIHGQTGATVARTQTGEMVISGFAPVPGTDWGIVTVGNWSVIKDLIQFYTRLFLFILWGGGSISALLIVFFIQKLLEPVRELTQGAEAIAQGRFVEIPVRETGDEIEVLARQFNSMARATEASFDSINRRVQELARAQKALKQSEEKINGIINAVNDAMLMVDDTGRIQWVNDKGRELFGQGAEKSPYSQVLYRQPDPPETCIIRACFSDGIESDTELSILTGSGIHDFWCTCSVVQKNRDRSVTRVVVVCRNLTEKKRLRAEVLRNAQLAALGELAAGIAHEINNPINGIINYAQIIEDSRVSGHPEAHAHLPGRIIKEGERIALIVSKLLSFARAGSERKEPLLLSDVIADVLDLTSTLLRKEGIRVNLEIPEDLPACRAVLHQIQQIFLNLISNARYALNRKYPGPDTRKTITISCSTANDSEQSMVRTSFLDNGTGIQRDILDKVLNPFFSTKPQDQGTGLGLSISYGIIEEHGGQLVINSLEGEWTEVSVTLPVWRQDSVKPKEELHENDQTHTGH